MRKTIVSAFVFVFVVLMLAVPASAQGSVCWGCIPGDVLEDTYYIIRGDEVGLLTASNVRMVREMTHQLPRSLYGNMVQDRRGYYGIQTSRSFHPMLDQNRQPLTGRQRIERGAGIVTVGAAVGGILGGKKGALIGAALGAGAAAVNDSRYRGDNEGRQRGNNDTIIVTPPPAPAGRTQQHVVVGSDGIPVAIGSKPLAGPAAQGRSCEFTLTNSTRFPLEVYDGEKYLGRMRPQDDWKVNAPEDGYKAYALIPNTRGSLTNDQTDIQPTDDGWMFTEPNFNGSGRQ